MRNWAAIARRIRVPLGFAFAVVYLWLAHPSAKSILMGAVLIIAGLGLRALASGHVQKNAQLTVTGPYAYTRHPLYLGSLILASGFALAARSGWIAAITAILFLAIYLPVIRSEDAFLRDHFAEFDQYAQAVPSLWPRFGLGRGAGQLGSGGYAGFSRDLYLKHREYNASLGAAAMMAALIAKMIWGR